MDKPKLCVDCKYHFILEKSNKFIHKCFKNKKEKINVVTGEIEFKGIENCYNMRSGEFEDSCCYEAIWFEPKEWF